MSDPVTIDAILGQEGFNETCFDCEFYREWNEWHDYGETRAAKRFTECGCIKDAACPRVRQLQEPEKAEHGDTPALGQEPLQGRCASCRHWDKVLKGYEVAFGLGACTRVRMFWNCTEWGDLGDGRWGRRLTAAATGNKAFLQDGSDYRAWLITLPDFGCVQFEPKGEA